ncbi:MAG: hypothetical protein R2744_08420 [Bacteroidales bacterium]
MAIFGDWHSKLYFPAMISIVIAVIAYMLIRDTPQSCGLPNIEEYKDDYPKDYQESFEKEFSAGEILKYVFKNKFLWLIAVANVMVYPVRYGILTGLRHT